MSDINTYSYLWDQSNSEFCLLECESSRGTYYRIYNLNDPTQFVPFHYKYPELRTAVIQKMMDSNIKIVTLEMKLEDPIRDYIRRQNWAGHVLTGGLNYLIGRWEKIVASVSSYKPQYYYEYLNDMDTRRILGELIDKFPNNISQENIQKVNELDTIIQEVLVPSETCIWGEKVAQERNYSSTQHWFYYHRPPVIDNSW